MHPALLCILSGILANARASAFRPTDISPEVQGIADSVLDRIKPFFGGGLACELSLSQIYHAESIEKANETTYKFDLKIGGSGRNCRESLTKTCIGIKIRTPPHCNRQDPLCYSLVDEDSILCVPELTVEPSDNPGDYKEISNPLDDPFILKIAQESTKFLYHLFNTSRPCPLHLADILSVKEQTINGINYELELQVETNGVGQECEYVMKHCQGLRVHQPLPRQCPFDRQFCLVPLDLNAVECTETYSAVY
eukprot:TRINITY_DN3481_c0_g1_i1.p1 TRINITY_DN3481_c0_g1~~TRINITY_DN3481_c0_g1_i1.p1  ORF type:complete len:252 (+),score=44.39 TRINITY_DN3481_c0_g1_i1:31-786(+)